MGVFPISKSDQLHGKGKSQGNPYKETARRQERNLARKLGGKRVPLSGGGSIKGDVIAPDVLVECKTGHTVDAAGEKQIVFKKDWLIKMKKEAEAEGRSIVFLEFRFKGDKTAWVVASAEDYIRLVTDLQAYKAQEKANG
jgi:hypothetical protein